MNRQSATFAGGCFWCLEAVFVMLRGVDKVVSGYMGGHVDNPDYDQICGGQTGHAEVVQISFDSTVIAYADLLEVFFSAHDPTTRDRQGNDIGSQYRSAVFWHDIDQKMVAESTVARMVTEKRFGAPIVTDIQAASTFWPAEDYHRDYFQHHPGQAYCQFVVSPKVMKVKAKYAGWLK